jgi:MerR family transcriptional regulator/heat shock protein HspR
MYDDMDERPVYSIGIISRLLDVHPETIRGWENFGIIKVNRINKRRYFSQNDVKRLRFAQNDE